MTAILKSPDNDLVEIKVFGICRKCKHYHPVEGITPDLFGRAAFDWEYKHRLCELEHPGSVEFLSPSRFIPKGFDDSIYEDAGEGPQWLDWKPNADVKVSYVTDAAFTITLTSLATSSSWTTGRESTAIVNTSNYLDFAISGKFETGTTNGAGPNEARLYYVRAYEGTPAWSGGIAGTGDANATITNSDILAAMVLGWSGGYPTTSNVTHPVQSALTMAQAFGIPPKNFLLYFSHNNSGSVALSASNNSNQFFYQGLYATVV